MKPLIDRDAQLRLTRYFDQIGDVLANKKRRASFATYAMGLLADGQRKSVEPIAARACGDPEQTDAVHQRLLHFLSDSPWSDSDVRRVAAEYAVDAMTEDGPIEAWIVDDTGFLKQGRHSVGVQRQYTGSAGKVTNCQVGVSLSVATRFAHTPIDFELYLPKTWATDHDRRRIARIPDDVQFQTKWQLAVGMLRRAREQRVPKAVVLADSDYGDKVEFRAAVRGLGLHYAVGIHSTARVWHIDALERRRGDPVSVRDLALQIGRRGFRRVTWREGAGDTLWSRFAAVRVVSAHDDPLGDPAIREDVWLLIEWPDGADEPTHYTFATLSRKTSRKQLVRLVKERYRTEQVYRELKTELGLDHFEGRRFPGWHHHVSIALCCYAFLVAERVRHSPPSSRGTGPHSPLARAA